MTPKLLPQGKKILAQILAGKEKPNYGLYVEYSNKELSATPTVDANYFETLEKGARTGYARIPVTATVVDDDGIICFGMLTSDDLRGGELTRNSVLTATTLVQLGTTQAEDVFIYTALLKQPVKIVAGTYITVNTKISIGGK